MIGTNNTTLSSQQLGDVNAQVASARAQKSDAESKARIIRDALKRGAATEVLRCHELGAAAPAVRAAGDVAGAARRAVVHAAGPASADQGAAGADRRSSSGRSAPRPSGCAIAFENDAKSAADRLQSLSAMLDQLKKQAGSSNEQDVKLRALEREAKSQRDLLESYLAKYREATARDNIGASSPEARIISRGIVSNTPSWPKKMPTVLIASLGMFTLAVGFILTGQLMSGPMPASAYAPVARTFEPAAPVAAPRRCRAGTRQRASRRCRRSPPPPAAAAVAAPSAAAPSAAAPTARSEPAKPAPPLRRRAGQVVARRAVPGRQATSRRRRRPRARAAARSRSRRRSCRATLRPPVCRPRRSRGWPRRSARRAIPDAGSRWSAPGATWARRSRRFRWRVRWRSRAGRCWSISRWSRPTCR